jgi:hypothetical protein
MKAVESRRPDDAAHRSWPAAFLVSVMKRNIKPDTISFLNV